MRGADSPGGCERARRIAGRPASCPLRACGAAAAVLAASLSCAPETGAVDGAASAAAVPLAVRVTTWRDDARAAYSLIHDDFCAGAEGILAHAVPELRARGLHAGLATVAGSCEASGLIPRLAELAAEGFEIVNHSYSHPHITPELAPHEIAEARRLLETYSRAPITFFAFPFDDYNDATIALVASAGHLGARAGGGGINPPDFTDPLRARFETYGPYSSYGNRPEGLDRYVDEAVVAGGWALRECHGVADTSWEPVPLDGYRAHLDHARSLVEAHRLWMALPSAVVRYRLARERCGPPSNDGNVLTFTANPACAETQSELTLALTLPAGVTNVSVRAAEQELPVRQNPSGEWIVTVDPQRPSSVFASPAR
jgi:peptidoglycan/xylan/chitin deacetylase (PgdA/CDA1 family)